ncbi:F-box/LRR-repeat protein 4-like [Magallana gigas]|uniref:F-box/LRR-repeat protein 4-like n=1 Tax=Magallana gigas TaxID=29159 RepID=UPI0033425FD0
MQASIHLWASEVTKFSSQYNTGSYSAKQVLGTPNVYPRYGDIPGTWTQARSQLDRVHFIEVKFPRKLFLSKVNIYETYHGGAVVKISAKNKENQWVDIFNITHAHVIRKSRKFSPQIKRTMFPVDELRIEVDCSASRSYVEIDAIEIVGDRCPSPFSQYQNFCYLINNNIVSGDEAFARCLQIGGYLANFETLEETILMKDTLFKMKTGISYFVGGRNINRRKPGGDWRWIKHGTMRKMRYFAFGGGQPDGTDRSPQDCLCVYVRDGYAFHDTFCGKKLVGYICEIEMAY